MDTATRLLSPLEAARLLQRGGLIIYPTETYYAIGCLANNKSAVENIYCVKKRNLGKPMPLVAADLSQAMLVADLETAPMRLFAEFWPGPLTVILPAKAEIAAPLRDAGGRIAIRVSSHPLARCLARLAKYPLTASSANISGNAPARWIDALDQELLKSLAQSNSTWGIVPGKNKCQKPGAPSTIVEPVRLNGQNRLRILRHGAIDKKALQNKNFHIAD